MLAFAAVVLAATLPLDAGGQTSSTERIVFDSIRNGPSQVFLMNPDGTGTVQVSPAGVTDTEPAFSLDGTKLAFISIAADGTRSLWVSDASGGNRAMLTSLGDEADPAFSPDGST